jgi:hypothetical protein
MKNVKNLIAIVTLVSVLGVGSSFAADQTTDGSGSNQQCSQTAESWLDGLFNYVKGYLTGDDQEIIQPCPELNGTFLNHNETLVRDEN